MIVIPSKHLAEFKRIYESQLVHTAGINVYYQNCRLLNNKHSIIDRDMYNMYFKDTLNDIELVSSPMDSFILCDNSVDKMFIVSRDVPEYEKIKNRMTLDTILSILPITNQVALSLKEKPETLETVIDDLFIYYSLFKYLDQIDAIRLQSLSTATPLVEYTVNNITYSDLKNYLASKKINLEKFDEKCSNMIFEPDLTMTHKFYLDETNENIPHFNVTNLLQRLSTNTILKSDVYIILAIYQTISFAVTDFRNNMVEDSKCAVYVRDVLSKL